MTSCDVRDYEGLTGTNVWHRCNWILPVSQLSLNYVYFDYMQYNIFSFTHQLTLWKYSRKLMIMIKSSLFEIQNRIRSVLCQPLVVHVRDEFVNWRHDVIDLLSCLSENITTAWEIATVVRHRKRSFNPSKSTLKSQRFCFLT